MNFKICHFNDLTVVELYRLLALRQAVFVVEQNCAYLDCDDKDLHSWHVLCTNEANELLAYCRLLPPRLAYPDYDDVSIGRVISSAAARNTGAGRAMMQKAMEVLPTIFPILEKPNNGLQVRIGAQSYLLRFYESFGFRSTGKTYLEDGIPHTEMICIIS